MSRKVKVMVIECITQYSNEEIKVSAGFLPISASHRNLQVKDGCMNNPELFLQPILH
jgi:hypothetical protein